MLSRTRRSRSGSAIASGGGLFDLFFKSYTEKVWGVPTSEIRADWAAQRIRTLQPYRDAPETPVLRADDALALSGQPTERTLHSP